MIYGSTISSTTTVLKGLWNFLNSRIFVIIIVVLLIMFAAGECKRILDLNRDVDQHNSNIDALKDTLKIERTKNGEVLVSIDGYIATEKELKLLNKGLWEQVRQLNGKVLSLTNTVISIKQDSADLAKMIDKQNIIISQLKEVSKDKYEAGWSIPYKFDANNFFTVKGKTFIRVLSLNPLTLKHDTTYLTGFDANIDVTYGEKVDKGKLRVYIESPFPGFSVKSMEGVLIDPNSWPSIFKPTKRHWFTGFGVGPNVSTGWNIIQAKPAITIGVGLHYNIYEW